MRYSSRIRSEGSASAIPTSPETAAAIAIPTRKFTPVCMVTIADVYAPTPKSAAWAIDAIPP